MANILLNTGFKQAFSLPLMSFYYEVNSSGDKFEQYRLLHVIHYKNKDVIGTLLVDQRSRIAVDYVFRGT